ncbi:diguanylate cyclase [Comamonas terrigena]|uniref:sensor domain-containing diguanylate cyclase n=1 Tax=Comamonas terrigena TaxID=32013 RepID=UPI00244A3E00|nr:sensor domain-containing diguanylate cyclase [Comamonas terrigena]MDH1290593.1 diguanylate cyclase [Comamonas terrigena]
MHTFPAFKSDLLQVALEQSFNAVMITNAERGGGGPVIVYCNAALCAMTGYSEAELLGQSPRMLQGPATDRAVLDRLRHCLEQGLFFEGAAINYRKNGEAYHLEWNISPVRDGAGEIRYFVSVQRDVSERVQADQERNLLAQALNASNDAILITDDTWTIVYANQACEALTGYARSELLGQSPMLLRSGMHEPGFYEALQACLLRGEGFRGTFINRHKNGSLYYAEQSIAALHNSAGKISHYVGVSKDITPQVQRETVLREQASRDKLTGLLNRHAGEYELQHCQMHALASGQGFGLILGDLDHFKRINDSWGHRTGDLVLKSVAAMLLQSVRSTDYVVRWGGEEFLVILPDVTLEMAQELAERIRSSVQGYSVPNAGHCSISLGVGVWQLGEAEESLLQRIDAALYASKERGRNRVTLAAQGGGAEARDTSGAARSDLHTLSTGRWLATDRGTQPHSPVLQT